MFDHPKLPTRKQAVGAVKGAAVEVARPVGAVVGGVIGALAAKTVAMQAASSQGCQRRAQAKDARIASQTPQRSHEKALEHATRLLPS